MPATLMLRIIAVAFWCMCLSMAGCVFSLTANAAIAGRFRCGNDPRNAEYLWLKADGSFVYQEISSSAVGLTLPEPFVNTTISGRWCVDGHNVVLKPIGTSTPNTFVRRYRILGPNATGGLQHIYGAGYVAPYSFVRISDSRT
ncbi:hypothetical protein ACXR0O_02950 [Verrucomicrobiota bacterium sgz303538]